MPVRNATPLQEAALRDAADNGLAVDADAGAMGMGQKAGPLRGASRWNACAIGVAWSLAPLICDLFSLGVRACVKLQLSWLDWAPPGEGAAGKSANRERGSNASGYDMDIASDAASGRTGRKALRSGKTPKAEGRIAPAKAAPLKMGRGVKSAAGGER